MIVQPLCPGCGGPPFTVLGGGTQAFCGDTDCETFTWNPTQAGGGRKYEMVAHESEDGRSVIWKPQPIDE